MNATTTNLPQIKTFNNSGGCPCIDMGDHVLQWSGYSPDKGSSFHVLSYEHNRVTLDTKEIWIEGVIEENWLLFTSDPDCPLPLWK